MDIGLPRRVALVVSGALLAGIVATVLQVSGIREVYAVVVALAGTMPILLEGMRPGEGADTTEGRLRAAAAEIAGALTVGLFGAFVLVLTETTGSLLVGGAALATYLGGILARSLTGSKETADD